MTKPRVTYRIEVDFDDMPVRGNAMASGDAAADKEVEDEILRRLDRGDVWAWASVQVVAECQGFRGTDSLGGCSYKDEEDFKTGGYYKDMRREALADLKKTLAWKVEDGRKAAKLLKLLS